MKLFKLLFATVGATVLLGALASTAPARVVSISNQNFRRSFQRFTFTFTPGDTICSVTFEGSYHSRTIAKVVGALIGRYTGVRIGGCTLGAATMLTETLPWHITYRNFTGALPNVTSIGTDIIGMSFRIREPFGVTCLVRSTAARPAVGVYRVEARTIVSASLGGTVTSGAECFGLEGTLGSDAGPVTVTGSSTRITLTLI